MACLEGFEPPTRGLEGRRSIQLSYRQPLALRVRFRPPESAVGIGAPRFELGTPCAQGRCATRLRYAPTETRRRHSVSEAGRRVKSARGARTRPRVGATRF